MLTRILSITLWRAALLVLAAFLIGAAGGALYMAMRHAAQQSAVKTVEKVVTQTVTVTDTAQVGQLKQQLALAKKDNATFQSRLAEAARANPAPAAPECRLSDSLRDDLNR